MRYPRPSLAHCVHVAISPVLIGLLFLGWGIAYCKWPAFARSFEHGFAAVVTVGHRVQGPPDYWLTGGALFFSLLASVTLGCLVIAGVLTLLSRLPNDPLGAIVQQGSRDALLWQAARQEAALRARAEQAAQALEICCPGASAHKRAPRRRL